MGVNFLKALLLGVFCLPGVGLAQALDQNSNEEATLLPTVRIFGSDRSVVTESMTPGVISKEVLKTQQITDVNRALKQSAGVYVREEEGQGLRANIGLRGTNPDRSKKVTLLEDGILIGPAPYSAPAAYYTPLMNHVERLEVFKGFKATGIGPNSIGGAIDYITLGLEGEDSTDVQSTFGSFGTWNTILTHSEKTSFGGFLINGSFLKSEGFKKLDGGGSTGFDKADLLTKLRWDLPSPDGRYQGLEFRFFFTNEDSKETYLGLTRSDFNRSPYRRYAASQLDEMKWDHRQFQIRHEFQPTVTSLIQTDLYHHEFHRTWYRLDRFRDGTALYGLLKDPTSGAANSNRYSILKGELNSSDLGGTDYQLVMARNDRDYFSQGIQSKWTGSFSSGAVQSSPWAGVRYHRDQIKRNHTADYYEMSNGSMVRTSDSTQQDSFNRESADAWTLTAGSDLKWRGFVLTPVFRYESIDFRLDNSLDVSKNNTRRSEVFLPGASLLYEWTSSMSTRFSYNEAATISGLSADGSEVKEEAKNFELELKFIQPEKFFEVQVTGFQMKYDHLTGTCTISSGCSPSNVGEAFQGGSARVQGVEGEMAKGFAWGEVFVPLRFTMTYLDAKFTSAFTSTSTEWGSSISEGDPLPYIPEFQYSFSFGTEWKKWTQELTFVYQSRVFDQSDPTDREEIQGFGIVDWSGKYQWNSNFSMIAKIDNVLSREYAVAARPFGFRSGKPQSFQVGARYEF